MAQHTVVLMRFYYPRDRYNTDNEIKESYFKVSRYDTEEQALDAYEHIHATWSTLLDGDEDYHKFIDEAYEHIKTHDFEWLCKHFV